jgi:tight adherence protein C
VTTDLVLLGLLAGLGLLLVGAGCRRRASLNTDLRRYGGGSVINVVDTRRNPLTLERFGTSLERLAVSADRGARHACDLAVTGRTLERHSTVVAVSTILGVMAPIALAGALSAAGSHLPAEGVLLVSGLGGMAGTTIPIWELRRSAGKERERFLHGFSCWLELVALAQAGGMGIESALEAACRVSPDAAFVRIRQALDHARHSGATPWAELGLLGSELGIDELSELAASLGLAGVEGARIRVSLTAKSDSLRRRQMSEAESRANSTTERLFLPSILLMGGFLIFILYPAGVGLTKVL